MTNNHVLKLKQNRTEFKEKQDEEGQGKKNPRRPGKKQPIDSRPRRPEEIEVTVTVLEQEENLYQMTIFMTSISTTK